MEGLRGAKLWLLLPKPALTHLMGCLALWQGQVVCSYSWELSWRWIRRAGLLQAMCVGKALQHAEAEDRDKTLGTFPRLRSLGTPVDGGVRRSLRSWGSRWDAPSLHIMLLLLAPVVPVLTVRSCH